MNRTETAAMLGISESSITRLVTAGLLHPDGDGLFARPDVEAIRARRRTMPRGHTGPGEGAQPFVTRSIRGPVV